MRPVLASVRSSSSLRFLRATATATAAAAFALLLCATPRASACHTVSEYGSASVRPSTAAEVSVEYAEFNLGARSGSYVVVAPSLEWAPHSRLSLALRVPIARLTYRGSAMSSSAQFSIGLRQALAPSTRELVTSSGLGDLGTSAKVALWNNGRVSLSAGLGLELPTGDQAAGLGGGHFELSPFLSFSARLGARGTIYGVVTDRLAVGAASGQGAALHAGALVAKHVTAGEPASLHGSLLSPHSDHELVVRVGAAYLWERFYVSGGAEQIAVWSGENGGLVLRAEAGAVLGGGLRIALGYDAPVVGAERYAWRGRLGVQWLF